MRPRRFLTAFLLAVLVVLNVVPNFAQETMPTYGRKAKAPQGPRAVAVLEWTAKGPRLIPISLKIDDKFYDAGLYMAQPVPMALETGVIYEIQKMGESLGDFTLEAAQQTPNGAWVGIGSYESKADQAKKREDAAKSEANAGKDHKLEEDSDEPPKLKRPKPKSDTDTKEEPVEAAKPANAAPAPSTQELHETTADPNRPVLKRGKPQVEQADSLGNEQLPTKKPAPVPAGLNLLQVAVSDSVSTPSHPYVWSWANPEEEQKIRAQAEKLAMTTLNDFASKTGGPKPGKLEDVQFQALDLSYSNSPDVIFSARVLPETKPPAAKRGARAVAEPAPNSTGLEYYVTVVGRQDIYATLQKSFAMATDNKHLDVYPRMHFIDAVDVDGNGNGDLVFRSTNDRGNSFVIYKELGFKLDEVIRVPEPKE